MSAPSGTVTFLFTDIEGSTRLWEQFPDAMSVALRRHDSMVRDAITRNDGYVFKTMGDAFSAAFSTAGSAATAAIEAQTALDAEPWDPECSIRVRMAIHTGTPQWRDNDYFGPSLNRVARLLNAAHGGQIVLSQAATSLLSAGNEFSIKDLGRHGLKDLPQPEPIFQLVHPGLPQDFPPLRSLALPTNNLPHQLTSFIGRERELQVVMDMVEASRLVTLTGAGGSGKTRLAIQVASELAGRFADGVWLVELAGLSDESLVPQAVAAALGKHEEQGRPIRDTLADYLQSRSLLLVLDNCEHVIAACANLTASLLRSTQNLRVLATSREPLAIRGESAWKVPVLSLPAPMDPLTVGSAVGSVSDNESVRLFVDRAATLNHGFSLDASNAAAVASICRRLDGIPLAIELAAGRTRFLTVDQIEKRLDDRFRLLTGGARGELPHHQTLRAAIDWGYDLLSGDEQDVFRTVSVFVGGCTLEAAESLCDRRESDGVDVLDLLGRLIDKSMVSMEEIGGASRFRLLETIREYGHHRLCEAGEEPSARSNHLNYFLRYAETAEAFISGPEQQIWLERLAADHDNFHAALDWCKTNPDSAEKGLRLATSLSRFWQIHGDFTSGRRYLRELMSLAGAPSASALWARAFTGAARLAYSQGDIPAAKESYEMSLGIGRELGDENRMASMLSDLGLVMAEEGDYDRAAELLEESVAITRSLGDKGGAALALGNLGLVNFYRCDYDRATYFYEQCLAQFRVLGDRDRIATTLNNLAELAVRRSDLRRANKYYEESLAMFQQLSNKHGYASVLFNLAELAYYEGQLELARTRCEESLAICKDLEANWGLAEIPARLGDIARRCGSDSEAAIHYKSSLETARRIGDYRLGTRAIEGLASIAVNQQLASRGARLLGASEGLRESLNWPLRPADGPEHATIVNAVRQLLDAETCAREWSVGRNMSSDAIIDYALS